MKRFDFLKILFAASVATLEAALGSPATPLISSGSPLEPAKLITKASWSDLQEAVNKVGRVISRMAVETEHPSSGLPEARTWEEEALLKNLLAWEQQAIQRLNIEKFR